MNIMFSQWICLCPFPETQMDMLCKFPCNWLKSVSRFMLKKCRDASDHISICIILYYHTNMKPHISIGFSLFLSLSLSLSLSPSLSLSLCLSLSLSLFLSLSLSLSSALNSLGWEQEIQARISVQLRNSFWYCVLFYLLNLSISCQSNIPLMITVFAVTRTTNNVYFKPCVRFFCSNYAITLASPYHQIVPCHLLPWLWHKKSHTVVYRHHIPFCNRRSFYHILDSLSYHVFHTFITWL